MVFACPKNVSADTVLITSDTTVAASDMASIEGKDIIVASSATLTVDGVHQIASLSILGTVTHTARQTNGVSLTISGPLVVLTTGKLDVTGKGCLAGGSRGET
ncbi:MAG: hypothetical protein QOF48_2887, partial [Verrucomicrobiota bacterium]